MPILNQRARRVKDVPRETRRKSQPRGETVPRGTLAGLSPPAVPQTLRLVVQCLDASSVTVLSGARLLFAVALPASVPNPRLARGVLVGVDRTTGHRLFDTLTASYSIALRDTVASEGLVVAERLGRSSPDLPNPERAPRCSGMTLELVGSAGTSEQESSPSGRNPEGGRSSHPECFPSVTSLPRSGWASIGRPARSSGLTASRLASFRAGTRDLLITSGAGRDGDRLRGTDRATGQSRWSHEVDAARHRPTRRGPRDAIAAVVPILRPQLRPGLRGLPGDPPSRRGHRRAPDPRPADHGVERRVGGSWCRLRDPARRRAEACPGTTRLEPVVRSRRRAPHADGRWHRLTGVAITALDPQTGPTAVPRPAPASWCSSATATTGSIRRPGGRGGSSTRPRASPASRA